MGFEADIYSSSMLSIQFERAARDNRAKYRRAMIDGESVYDAIDEFFSTADLASAFLREFDSFFYKYDNSQANLIDFYNNRLIWDIYELFHVKAMDGLEGGTIHNLNERLIKKIENELPENPNNYTKDVGKIYHPIETEEEMDNILLGMLHHKLTHSGKVPMEYCYFIIRQCFYEGSALMKNKEKYEEVVYRFLEEFTKGKAISNAHKAERRACRLLKEEMSKKTKDPKRTRAFFKLAMDEIKDLVQKGWVFRTETGRVIADFLAGTDISDEDRKEFERIIENAYASDIYDNSPVVAIKELPENFLGTANSGLICLDSEHISKMVYGTPAEKLRVIETIFHENTHFTQERNFNNPNTYLRYSQLKYHLLWEKGEIEHDINYDEKDITEREAFLIGADEAIAFAIDNDLPGVEDEIKVLKEEAIDEENMLVRNLADSVPIIVDEKTRYSRPMSELFDSFIQGAQVPFSRAALEYDFGDNWYGDYLRPKVRKLYMDDKSKEVRPEDFESGTCILGDYPVLRIEYENNGEKRSFDSFLKNARNLINTGKFVGSDKKARFTVDENMVKLMKDIGKFDMMTLENIPDVLYSLSKMENQFTENDNPLYKSFIRELTAEGLKMVFEKATELWADIPLDKMQTASQMCILVHMYMQDDTRESKEARREFLSGMNMPSQDGKTALDMMYEFLEGASDILGIDYMGVYEDAKKNGKNIFDEIRRLEKEKQLPGPSNRRRGPRINPDDYEL